MKDVGIKKLVYAALLAALVTVATMAIAIPLPASGYANMGDCVVILAGCLLGPVLGGVAAGIGSALADILIGYTAYAPATFIIKALMAMQSYYVIKFLARKPKRFLPAVIVAVLFAEAIMIGGYFIYESIIIDRAAAMLGVWGNLMQAAASATAAVFLLLLMNKTPRLKL